MITSIISIPQMVEFKRLGQPVPFKELFLEWVSSILEPREISLAELTITWGLPCPNCPIRACRFTTSTLLVPALPSFSFRRLLHIVQGQPV